MGHETSQIARRCERAVVTAYRDLRHLGSDDLTAFTACTTLYRIHHPEASINEARRLVADSDALNGCGSGQSRSSAKGCGPNRDGREVV